MLLYSNERENEPRKSRRCRWHRVEFEKFDRFAKPVVIPYHRFLVRCGKRSGSNLALQLLKAASHVPRGRHGKEVRRKHKPAVMCRRRIRVKWPTFFTRYRLSCAHWPANKKNKQKQRYRNVTTASEICSMVRNSNDVSLTHLLLLCFVSADDSTMP